MSAEKVVMIPEVAFSPEFVENVAIFGGGFVTGILATGLFVAIFGRPRDL